MDISADGGWIPRPIRANIKQYAFLKHNDQAELVLTVRPIPYGYESEREEDWETSEKEMVLVPLDDPDGWRMRYFRKVQEYEELTDKVKEMKKAVMKIFK